MQGYICGIADNSRINYCPLCRAVLGTNAYYGDGTVVCSECDFHFDSSVVFLWYFRSFLFIFGVICLCFPVCPYISGVLQNTPEMLFYSTMLFSDCVLKRFI